MAMMMLVLLASSTTVLPFGMIILSRVLDLTKSIKASLYNRYLKPVTIDVDGQATDTQVVLTNQLTLTDAAIDQASQAYIQSGLPIVDEVQDQANKLNEQLRA